MPSRNRGGMKFPEQVRKLYRSKLDFFLNVRNMRLATIYKRFRLKSAKSGFWCKPENRRAYFDFLLKQLGNSLDNFYHLKYEQVEQSGGAFC